MNSSKATYKPSEYRFIEAFFGRGLITTSGAYHYFKISITIWPSFVPPIGPTHKKHRSLIMPMVNGKALDTYINSFDTQSRRCVECLDSMVDEREFNILPFMDMCTIDITFGKLFRKMTFTHNQCVTSLLITWLQILSLERLLQPNRMATLSW